MPQQSLNGCMDLGRAHRHVGCPERLDDRSLNHAVAEPAARSLRLRACRRTYRPIQQSLEHRFQGSGRVRELSYQVHQADICLQHLTEVGHVFLLSFGTNFSRILQHLAFYLPL